MVFSQAYVGLDFLPSVLASKNNNKNTITNTKLKKIGILVWNNAKSQRVTF